MCMPSIGKCDEGRWRVLAPWKLLAQQERDVANKVLLARIGADGGLAALKVDRHPLTRDRRHTTIVRPTDSTRKTLNWS